MYRVIRAPSILGLRPTGVELLADTLLREGLRAFVTPEAPLLEAPSLNHLYSARRDGDGMRNAGPLRAFSLGLMAAVGAVAAQGQFPVVLGGDCSILLGALPAMKARGTYGLVTLDAHADFYLSTQSVTGEAADMDVALVTGRGPKGLTDIDGLGPYVRDAHVLHVGQRDEAETLAYGAAQIAETEILRYGLEAVQRLGVEAAVAAMTADMRAMGVAGCWMHLDADVLHDADNPAVDYRLPGGLRMAQCGDLMRGLMRSGCIVGLSVSIYNPKLDADGTVGKRIAEMVGRALA